MGNVVDICHSIGLNNGEIGRIFDPQIFIHMQPENQQIRDISKEQSENLISAGEVTVRIGIAGILEEANDQLSHGLTANFGLKNLSLPAVFASDIDVSDAEALLSTLQSARGELSQGEEMTPKPILRCIAKRMKPNQKNFVRCNKPAVINDQFCPLHLCVSDL